MTEPETDTDQAPLSKTELEQINAYWRAANYLSVGQIYLMDNPLLREPLRAEDIKPRLLGHWGTTPGLNLIYAHANRLIRNHDLEMIYVTGPGHGGPGIVANTYLEGTYSEFYPNIGQDAAGMQRLFRQFSFPGGIPSHAAPETPGSIHEGGELGYSLSHAFGAVYDHPDLIAVCVVGDGEAETGPLATGWHSNKFLNPVTDGAVLPILHLNGYKIANPTVLARIPDDELASLFEGYGYTVHRVTGDDPELVHQQLAATLDQVVAEISDIPKQAREDGDLTRPRWPMIVLKTPKGWTGPKTVDGVQVEGTFRAHQVPIRRARQPGAPPSARGLDAQLPAGGAVRRQRDPDRRAGRPGPRGDAPDGRQPGHQRRPAAARPEPAELPRLRGRGDQGRHRRGRGDPGARHLAAGRDPAKSGDFPPVRPGRDRLQPAAGRVPGDEPGLRRGDPAHRRSPGSRGTGDGGAVGAPVRGLAGGLPADRPARPVQLLRGVHPHRGLDVQPARQVARGLQPDRVAAARRLAELPAVQPGLAAGPERVLAPGPGFPGRGAEQAGRGGPGLPPPGRQHPAVGRRSLPAVA